MKANHASLKEITEDPRVRGLQVKSRVIRGSHYWSDGEIFLSIEGGSSTGRLAPSRCLHSSSTGSSNGWDVRIRTQCQLVVSDSKSMTICVYCNGYPVTRQSKCTVKCAVVSPKERRQHMNE